ncbi:MAG: beta-lactamase family protein [Actinobacteria bacterium]|nr:beta-lactamase family protein [Actinomycetota bacterium]MBO0785299.1 beta-lactamase family protein [Actinomycetota bacterium]MBO0814573.1 beta-lactamase family protein [Actinomycetota bacterium]
MSVRARLAAAFDGRPDPAAVPAASLALAVDAAEVTAAWGVADGTLFQAASISKPVAAMAVLRLVAQGRLSLDADVNQYLTSWHLPGQAGAAPVTIRHLLSHTGALTVSGFPGYERDEALPSLPEILDGRPPASTPPVRREGTPGEAHRYSGGGYCVLQQLLEDVTAQPFAGLAADLVLRPAGMTTATYAEPDRSDAATPQVDGQPVAWHAYPEHAAAGLWCAPADLVRFGRAVQAAIAGDAGALLPRELAVEMVTPQAGGWGLGLMLSGNGADRQFGHGGGNYGYQCALIGTAFSRRTVAVMTSSDRGLPAIWTLLAAVRDATAWPGLPTSEDDWQ